jgi:hypothetical protein
MARAKQKFTFFLAIIHPLFSTNVKFLSSPQKFGGGLGSYFFRARAFSRFKVSSER